MMVNLQQYKSNKMLPLLTQVRDVADAHHLAMHLDGARLMHAAVAQEVAPCEIAQYFDSVSMCFSKVSVSGMTCRISGYEHQYI